MVTAVEELKQWYDDQVKNHGMVEFRFTQGDKWNEATSEERAKAILKVVKGSSHG